MENAACRTVVDKEWIETHQRKDSPNLTSIMINTEINMNKKDTKTKEEDKVLLTYKDLRTDIKIGEGDIIQGLDHHKKDKEDQEVCLLSKGK